MFFKWDGVIEYPTINICIEDVFIESFTINLSDKFYDLLENYLKEKGINKITYNNTKSCFFYNNQ